MASMLFDTGLEDGEAAPGSPSRSTGANWHNLASEDRVGEAACGNNEDPGKGPADGLLSCPYRKRNPARFNIRDHVECTNSFNDLSDVKLVCPRPAKPTFALYEVTDCRHAGCTSGTTIGGQTNGIPPLLVIFFPCEETPLTSRSARCLMQFPSLADLVIHKDSTKFQCATVPKRQRDVEDGPSPTTRFLLAESHDHAQVSTWTDLWKMLFPKDLEVPLPSTPSPIPSPYPYTEASL